MALNDNSAFVPSANAFGFVNSWPSAPAVTVQTPFGRIAVGNAANGLCGGMAFGSLDYWYARETPPRQRPAPGSPLYKFVVRRLIDSWNLPCGASEYYQWMNLPDGDSTVQLLGRTVTTQRGLSWRTIEQQWPQVRSNIDQGTPSPLGVITVASANPAELGVNHQVLAYGYSLTGTQVTLHVYDPNTGPADDTHISFDTSAPTEPTTFTHNINMTLPVRGFFVSAYSPASVSGLPTASAKSAG